MNPPNNTPRTRLEAALPAPQPGVDDAGVAPLSAEDLIGDLDPGWLNWREEQAGR